jgi:hypothetical protein
VVAATMFDPYVQEASQEKRKDHTTRKSFEQNIKDNKISRPLYEISSNSNRQRKIKKN